MALQEDPTKTFGSTSYFKNKDDQRKAVNETRQAERQKRIATQLLRRNMKKSMRAGGDGGNFMQAAKLGKLDIFGSNGLGEEAGAAMARARYDVDQNFQAAAKAKAQRDAGVGNAGQTPVANVGTPPQPGTTVPTGNIPPASVTQPPPVYNQDSEKVDPKMSREDQIKSLRPDWADEVKYDRTFKNVDFNDPETLTLINGKSRVEVYDMLMKAKASRLMSGASEKGKAGKSIIAKEKGISEADNKAYFSSLETAGAVDNLANNLSEENFQLMGTTREKFLQKATQNNFGSNEFQVPSADYYSMSLDEQIADYQKRSKDYDYAYNKSKEAQLFEQMKLDSQEGFLKTMINTENPASAEARAKKESDYITYAKSKIIQQFTIP